MFSDLKRVRECVIGHRVKDAFQRVLNDCGLDASEFDDKAKLLAHLMYVQGRDDQLNEVSQAVKEETAKVVGET